MPALPVLNLVAVLAGGLLATVGVVGTLAPRTGAIFTRIAKELILGMSEGGPMGATRAKKVEKPRRMRYAFLVVAVLGVATALVGLVL